MPRCRLRAIFFYALPLLRFHVKIQLIFCHTALYDATLERAERYFIRLARYFTIFISSDALAAAAPRHAMPRRSCGSARHDVYACCAILLRSIFFILPTFFITLKFPSPRYLRAALLRATLRHMPFLLLLSFFFRFCHYASFFFFFLFSFSGISFHRFHISPFGAEAACA